MTSEAMSLSRALYYNDLGMRDKFSDYWQVVTERFYGNPNVIGIDPINEPFPAWDSLFGMIQMMLEGGHFDRTLLAPMYEDIYTKMNERIEFTPENDDQKFERLLKMIFERPEIVETLSNDQLDLLNHRWL
jgi:hypothetical protein